VSTYRVVRFSEGDQIRVTRPLLNTGWTGQGTVIEQDAQLVYFWREIKASESFNRSNRQRCVCCRNECELLTGGRPKRTRGVGVGNALGE